MSPARPTEWAQPRLGAEARGAGDQRTSDAAAAPPLAGLTVLDFSTLLPGPLAGLMLAEAGATVIKVERPGLGDEMRGYAARFGDTSANFALLNRGKRSVAIDLKSPGATARLAPLLETADVLIEQFRPGVMARLGLGYEALSAINPHLVYCSITGFGQSGPRAQVAGHDLNYLALSGLLSLTRGADGAPGLPPTPIADIAGGSWPAITNILLALIARERSGRGTWIDVSMTDSLAALAYWALGQGHAAGDWPRPGAGLITGGSPRYQVYATSDGRYLAAAPLEDRFWARFCALIDLPAALREDARDPQATRDAVAARIAAATAAHWDAVFAGEDVCCCTVQTMQQAAGDLHSRSRGLFARQVSSGGRTMPALAVPIAAPLRTVALSAGPPALGEANDELLAGEA